MPGHCLCGGEGQIFGPRAAQPRPWGRAQLGREGSWGSVAAAGQEEPLHGAMQPLQRLGTRLVWGRGMPRERCWTVAMSAGGSGQCLRAGGQRSAWAGPSGAGLGGGGVGVGSPLELDGKEA